MSNLISHLRRFRSFLLNDHAQSLFSWVAYRFSDGGAIVFAACGFALRGKPIAPPLKGRATRWRKLPRGLCALMPMLLTPSFTRAADALPESPKPREKYETFAMTHSGDPVHGKELFQEEKKLACSRCHAIDGKQTSVGPNLFAIGDKFGRRELVESVLLPSATIAEGYASTIITTKAGDTLDGIIKESTADLIALARADGQITRIKVTDIQEQRNSTVSLMPEGLQNALTFQEFADLIDYLASLKVAETTAATQVGMPATIEELKQPIALRPFHSMENKFAHPVWFGPLPGVSGSFAVVEHETGKLWRLDKGAAGESKTVFLDTGRMMPGAHGLMGVVFHPKFTENRKYYVVKQPVEKGIFFTQICEGIAAADLKTDSGQPLRELLKIEGSTTVHCGGDLQFGPDGFLYIGMGDSGPQQDPHGNAQDTNLLRGKMLRIDIDHAETVKPYAIPPDNPFINTPGIRPEIWAIGFREPWRYSFDSLTGDLWVGDVGQDLIEEVDVVQKGQNYGWSVYEGFSPFSNQYRRPDRTFTPPIFAYTRKYGVSMTGGYVYRGDPKSDFYGVYICADFQTRRVFGLTREGATLKKVRQIALAPQRVVSFGQGEHGELYLVGYDGTIFEMDLSAGKFE
jgi:putative heme-binding domain-containing protein